MQPTAMSASASSRATGTAPVEWQRSHCTSAPASWAAAVRAGCRTSRPERKSTWVSASSATSSSSEAAGSAGSHQRSSRSSSPRDPGGDVPVGRERRRLQHDHPAAGPQPRGGDERLEQRHAGRVARRARRPRRRRSAARSSRRPGAAEPDPVGGVPRRDQPGAPLVGDHLLHPRPATSRGSAPSELPSR